MYKVTNGDMYIKFGNGYNEFSIQRLQYHCIHFHNIDAATRAIEIVSRSNPKIAATLKIVEVN